MDIQDLPRWSQAIPVLIGVVMALVGMQIFPFLGMRPALGPILGLPVGFLIGFVALGIWSRTRSA
jgi:hypothetical protein